MNSATPSPSAGAQQMVMNVPTWAWCTFGLCLLLVLLFLLLDWLLIRRNALGSSPICLSFRRHPSGKYGYASSTGSGGMGGGGADWQGGQGGGYTGGGSLGPSSGQSGAFGHHKRKDTKGFLLVYCLPILAASLFSYVQRTVRY